MLNIPVFLDFLKAFDAMNHDIFIWNFIIIE